MPFPKTLARIAALACWAGMTAAQAAGALPGTLWHAYSDLNNPEGTFATNPGTGQSRWLTADPSGTPWPDGSRYLTRDYTSQGSGGDVTRLVVRRISDQAVLMDQAVDGYIGDHVRPSPRGGNQILVMWGESILEPRGPVVYDLDSRRLLYVTRPSRTPDALSWLPDGSLLRVQPSGQISRVVLGGAEQPVAAVRWPEGRVPQALHVSPDGSKALVQLAALRDTGSVSGADLWMMNVDGSNLRRFTKNDLVAQAFWSPDSKHVAFVKDTGVSCSDATCRGSCALWVAEATAADVVAVKASGDAQRIPLRRPNGSMTTVGCPAIAWTR
ncbi:hypothetical protein ASC95_15670 [Pelomonas sp. Root1217]|uniref:TolB family protein n=1 Tax=Pelomonas sp. Root1217 TaxID=1736430 RepID=UPI00070A5F7F|nr:hypothetical protein [Pelomonas sp. Root1217]KQV50782.1 hypothetical protein ASC95_15670 [Pelomonas sp. Root1217]